MHVIIGEVKSMFERVGRDTTVWWAAIAIGAGVLRKSGERVKTSGPRTAIGGGKCEGRC